MTNVSILNMDSKGTYIFDFVVFKLKVIRSFNNRETTLKSKILKTKRGDLRLQKRNAI